MDVRGTGVVHADPRLAAVYQAGNGIPAESLRGWAELIAGYAPAGATAVLEVGAGTGVFCAALARALPAVQVVGVDPAAPMLEQAERLHAHPRVRYLPARAEALPLPAEGFDLALLSRVVHHLSDRPAAARELVRVLRPGGRLVIRTTFRERLDAPVYDYWPRLRETDAARFPSEGEVLDDFTAAGLAVHRICSHRAPVASGLGEFRDRLALRAESKFDALSPAEFAAGLDRLTAAARAQRPPRPVEERYDLVVLERPARRGGRPPLGR
ncbi:methyltransferase domain-containing protein [Kitasatospora sp. NPDC052896]|uniref:class I SAM-dependent methyltransferase n=1 Tax=Kitasatospora sp. NPDC052896 TaxID=3364061 RepID=UPI0037C7F2AC